MFASVRVSLDNLKELERLLQLDQPRVRSHDNHNYRFVWVAITALELVAVAYSFATGEFHTSIFYGLLSLLTLLGICCALQASNNANAGTIKEAEDKITWQISIEKMVQDAIAAILPIAPKIQLTPPVVNSFGRITSNPPPTIEKISANTPLHFAS